jgi:hypothetical protein
MAVDRHVYEIGIFNARVRKALAEGTRDADLSDEWADIHYFEILAADERGARSKIERRYPAAYGYVIADVKQLR